MKIYSQDGKIHIEIDKLQPWEDAAGESMGMVMNVVGVYTDNEFEQGIYQAIELGYKDDVQLGMPILMTCLQKEEFMKLCEDIGIEVWSYPSCDICKKTIWGCITSTGKYNALCYDCSWDLEKGNYGKKTKKSKK